jgi:predicted peroxiredoxin
MFFQPGAARALVKGELEKLRGQEGMPDPIDLYESIQTLDGRFILCELGLPNKGIKEEDLRDGVEVMMASSFLFDAEGAVATYCY